MDIGFLEGLGLISIFAAVIVSIGRLLKMPAIVVYLLCGILLGPVLGWVKVNKGLEIISELGIALLLFLVGMELSLSKIKDVGAAAITAGFIQVFVTTICGYGIGLLLGFDQVGAVFLGLALTFSSTVVVVKLLEQKGELVKKHGRISLGILLVQDLVVIFVLTFLAGFSADGSELNAAAIGMDLLKAFAGMLLLLVGALVAAKFIFPYLFRWVGNSPEVMMIWALAWCFAMVVGAHAFHLSLEVGAFLAGLSLAQLPYNEGLLRRVNPLMNLFIAIFFVTLGLKINLDGALQKLPIVLMLVGFVLFLKPLIFMLILRWQGHHRKTASLTGITLAQTSEFAFILGALAISKGLIGNDLMLISALVGVITIAVSSYLISFNDRVFVGLEKIGLLGFLFKKEREAILDESDQKIAQHIIVVGMNTLGKELVRRLHRRGETVIAMDTDPRKLEGLPGRHVAGSVTYISVLEEAHYAEAKLIVSALQIEEVNDIIAFRAKCVGVPCAIHVVDLSMIDNLLELDADYLMVSKVDGMKAQMVRLREMGILR